jgi:hypothetical protein
MSYAVRKYIYNGHRPVCGACGGYIPMDSWFFMREKYRRPSQPNHKWLQSAKNYKCIACVFNVDSAKAHDINAAYNMRETLNVKPEFHLKYPEAKAIADAAKGLP